MGCKGERREQAPGAEAEQDSNNEQVGWCPSEVTTHLQMSRHWEFLPRHTLEVERGGRHLGTLESLGWGRWGPPRDFISTL